MDLDRTLAAAFLASHPRESSRVLETIAVEEAAALLLGVAPEDAAQVLERASSHFARTALAALSPSDGATLLAALPLDRATALVRGMEPEARERLLGGTDPDLGRAIRALLGFPDGTAGAVMDPKVLALRSDLPAAEALERVRSAPSHVLYNLYVVDEAQRLVGVLNLRELLLAPPDAGLGTVMQPPAWRLAALTDRRALVEHPGWREVHALPVVDRQGRFLGAVRYRTMRRLEDALRERASEPSAPTAEALGDLFWTGVAGLLDAVGAPRR